MHRWRAALALLPDLLDQHVVLSASALALGLLLSLPLAVVASRNPAVRWPSLFLASLVQTIPGLGAARPLLSASVGVVGSYRTNSSVSVFPALGFAPSLLALTLYSMLPILRTAVAALLGIDKAVIEAARGMGMTSCSVSPGLKLPSPRQLSWPGANRRGLDDRRGDPVYFCRPAIAWQLYFPGIADGGLDPRHGWAVWPRRDWLLATDQLIGLVESGLIRRRPWRIWAGAMGLAAGLAAALVPVVVTVAWLGASPSLCYRL